MLKITRKIEKNCRILHFLKSFSPLFTSLNFNKMHLKQERVDFSSDKEKKNAENCKKLPKNDRIIA